MAAVHDYGEYPGRWGEPVPYVVMELVDGPTLTDVLADGPVDPSEAMRICADVAAGLAAAHARGLVHRDVKPANVIVTAGGAKLVDFGIAAAIGDPDEADEDGVMFGTPAYLAPERLEDGVVVPGSDVYALGLLLYRLLAGHPPWSAQTTVQMLRAHAYLPPEPLPTTVGVPPAAADLCHRCLAKDPADRPSAAEVAALLNGATKTPPSRSSMPPEGRATDGRGSSGEGLHRPAVRRRKRRRAAVAALVALLVVGLALLAPRLLGGPSDPGDPGDQSPGTGALPDPVRPSFPGVGPAATGASGQADGAAAGAQPGTGAGSGVGPAGAPPAGTASEPAAGGGVTTTSPGEPEPTARPDPARRTVDTTGGSAVIECAGVSARLISWTPAAGFEAQAVQAGPAPNVQVRFRAGNDQVSIHGKCVDGVPDVRVR